MRQRKIKKLASNIRRSEGDAIAGERVITQARSIGKIIIVYGSSKHRAKQMTLRGNVFCVIDRAFRTREIKMRSSRHSTRD